MPRKLRLAAIVLAGLAAVVVLAREIESRLGPDVLTVTPRGSSSVVEARLFDEYALYSAGPSFRGLALNGVGRLVNRRRGATREVSFYYGTCDIPLWKGKADGGCGLPLSIQNWRSCEKGIHGLGYHNDPGASMTVRGVPAALYEAQGRLALATGETTIIIYATGREKLLEVARLLRGVNVSVNRSEELPEPAPGRRRGC
jgi:hypothetical protein